MRWGPGKNGYFKFYPKADRGHESPPSTFAYENRKSWTILLTKIIDYAYQLVFLQLSKLEVD